MTPESDAVINVPTPDDLTDWATPVPIIFDFIDIFED